MIMASTKHPPPPYITKTVDVLRLADMVDVGIDREYVYDILKWLVHRRLLIGVIKKCSVCSTVYLQRTRGRSTYCSKSCSNHAKYIRAKERNPKYADQNAARARRWYKNSRYKKDSAA